MRISIDDIQKEIERLNAEQPDGFTTREYADSINKHIRTAREQIRELVLHGRVELAGYRRAENMAGVSGKIPVYRIVGGKK